MTPKDIADRLSGCFDSTVDLSALALAMWEAGLSPEVTGDLQAAFRLIGLDPDDYGIGR